MQRHRPEPLSSLESHLSYWLHYVGQRIFLELHRRALQYGVTAAESVFLRKLHEYENGVTPSILAWHLGLSRGHISRLAMRLEIKGLVDRDRSRSDRRARILSLNGYGRVLLPYLAAAANGTDARSFGVAGDGPRESIEGVMKWIVRVNRCRWVPPGRCRIVYTEPDMDRDLSLDLDPYPDLDLNPDKDKDKGSGREGQGAGDGH